MRAPQREEDPFGMGDSMEGSGSQDDELEQRLEFIFNSESTESLEIAVQTKVGLFLLGNYFLFCFKLTN